MSHNITTTATAAPYTEFPSSPSQDTKTKSPFVSTRGNSSHHSINPLEYSGRIPDSVRKSYVQQKLPVRKQSLAAFGQTKSSYRQKVPVRRVGSSILHPAPPERALPSTLTAQNAPTRSATVTFPPPPRFSPPCLPVTTSVREDSIHTSSVSVLSSLPETAKKDNDEKNQVDQNSGDDDGDDDNDNDNGNDNDDDDDDFYFGDRPPSTISCTRPILSSSNSSVSLYGTPPMRSVVLSSSTDTSDVTAPSNIITQPLTKDDDDDDSTVFSPETPAVYSPEGNTIHTWPTPVASLSETIITEEHERTCWRKGSVGDIIQNMSSSLPDNTFSPPATIDRPRARQDIQPIDTSIDHIKLQEQRKSIHAYHSPPPPTPSSQQQQQLLMSTYMNSSTLSLQRSSSRSSSMFISQFYPALLSRLAQELYRRLPVYTLIKHDIEYSHAFSGKEAVDCLLQILRTNDRNLGLLVGRALDCQQLFHDVTYEHHLRDSRDKIYQFKHRLDFSLSESPSSGASKVSDDSPLKFKDMYTESDKMELPNGVFTLLTNCYSPTCARGQGCYSFLCPRKVKSLRRSSSQSSLQEKEEKRSLWIHSVPKSIVDATSKEEMKRQECIYELIYTEADFVKDLQYVHNFWVKPLITQDIIPDEGREHFVQEVFWNMADIEKVNSVLSQSLLALQKEQHVVKNIGDLLLGHVTHFDPFVAYGAHQVIGKFKFELEKKRNPVFAQFVQNTERLPESRRLELNGYLTKPTTRLGKYNLLLREILKRTPKDNRDYETIPKVMDIITGYLVQVNTETGKCENIFNLQQIEERLSFKSSADHVDLALRDPQRQMIIQGRMKRKGNSSSDASDLQVFLFDHYLVFAKIKYHDHLEYYKVYRKPIPLDLLTVTTSVTNLRAKRASTLLAYSRSSGGNSNSHSTLPRASTSENLLASKSNVSSSITFYHHGRKGSPPITLYVSNISSRKTWMEKILGQQSVLSTKRSVFRLQYLVSRQFLISNRVHDSILIDSVTSKKSTTITTTPATAASNTQFSNQKYTMLIGTDMGVYVRVNKNFSKSQGDNSKSIDNDNDDDEWDEGSTVTKRVIPLDKISQIELMEDTQLLVLADKTLWTFQLDDILDSSDKPLSMKKGRTISTNTAFFHVGECMNKTMVCIAKPNTLATTTIRVLEPIATDESKKAKSGFSIRRLVRNGPVGLKSYKDLYLPSEASSISLLKSKMCISCPREIGVVDMKSFGVQALLDPEDEELSFVFARQDIRPITIYRVQFAEYLVCYNEFGFFVDQRGRWIRSSHIMEWEGEPDAFALSYPHVLVFEPGFIEVRNIITGQVDQLIRGKNIRCTSTRDGTIQGSMNDPDNDGYQVIFQLDRIQSLAL